MKVKMGRIQDSRGEWGCCKDNKGIAYCQWLIHGHPFCNNGCTWEEENEMDDPSPPDSEVI